MRAAVTLLHDRSAWGLPSRPLVVGSRCSASEIGKEAKEAVLAGSAAGASESGRAAVVEEREEAAAERDQGHVETISPDATPVGVSLVVGEHPEILDELSRNVLRQRKGVPAVRWVQEAHLGAVASLLEAGDVKGAAGRLRYLNIEYGVLEEHLYRSVLHQLVLALRPQVPQQAPASSPVWTAVRKEETRIAVQELLASGSVRLIKLFQTVWDDHIHRESQRSARHSHIAPPLEALHALLLLVHGQAGSIADPGLIEVKEGETNDAKGEDVETEANGTSEVEGEGEVGGEPGDRTGHTMGEMGDGGKHEMREGVRRESVEERCVWELVEHTRVERRVVVGSELEGALAAVHAGQFSKANHILHLCPPLRPLTTLIAWDLIGPSHPAIRLRLLWALWPLQCSHALLKDWEDSLQHEGADSSLLPHESSQDLLPIKPLADCSWPSQQQQLLEHAGVCCVHLIYHAHLAFRIAARHAASQQRQQQQEQQQPKPYNHHPQLHRKQHLKSQRQQLLTPKAVARMVRAADPFVARLALELLQVQPPLHVLLSLGAHGFQPGEIIQLLQAQPGAGCNVLGGASGRDWDVELLHMLFGAQAAEAAVHAMTGSGRGGEEKGEGKLGVQQRGAAEALSAVESFEHHAAQVTTAARKIWMGYTVRSLLLAASNSPATEPPSTSHSPADEDCLAAVTMARLQLLAKHDAAAQDADFAAELDAELDAQASDVAAAAVGVLASDWKQRAQVVRDWLDDWQWRLAVLKADWLGVRAGGGKSEAGVLQEDENLERIIHEEGKDTCSTPRPEEGEGEHEHPAIQEEGEVENEDEASGSEQEVGMEGGGRKAGEVKGQAGKWQERWRLRSDWSAWGWHEVVAWMRVDPSALVSW
ncbi:unnamed protein product [Closterium sp. Yama58-4]|nr:unnamed protein product [Closterium sp. Yama58-4]